MIPACAQSTALRSSGPGCVHSSRILHLERAIEALELSGYEVFVAELHPKLYPPPGMRIAANLELRPEGFHG